MWSEIGPYTKGQQWCKRCYYSIVYGYLSTVKIGTIHKHFTNVKSPEISNCPVHEVFKIKVHGMSNLFSNNLGKNIHQQR